MMLAPNVTLAPSSAAFDCTIELSMRRLMRSQLLPQFAARSAPSALPQKIESVIVCLSFAEGSNVSIQKPMPGALQSGVRALTLVMFLKTETVGPEPPAPPSTRTLPPQLRS